MNGMVEVRWHGRGGQGAWTASELLARAAINEGKFIQSFPEFGPERMGAPICAFTRISNKQIQLHCSVYNPDIVAVLDSSLLETVPVTEGMRDGGSLIVNFKESPQKLRKLLGIKKGTVWTVPATDIAIKFLNRPIMNTAVLGALVRATGIVKLKSVEKAVSSRFSTSISEKNIGVIKEAYKEAKKG